MKQNLFWSKSKKFSIFSISKILIFIQFWMKNIEKFREFLKISKIFIQNDMKFFEIEKIENFRSRPKIIFDFDQNKFCFIFYEKC